MKEVEIFLRKSIFMDFSKQDFQEDMNIKKEKGIEYIEECIISILEFHYT